MAAHWPRLCALEGPSGCGKSTLVPLVVRALLEDGINARAVTNNDAGSWGPLIRELAVQPDRPLALALATAGARAEIRETASPNVVLVSDRYVLSSYVYQGFAGVPAAVLDGINAPLLAATTTFLLTCPADLLSQRRAGRDPNHFDWFKRTMTLNDEMAGFDAAATYLRSRGHIVQTVEASSPATEVAGVIAASIAKTIRLSM